MFHVLYFAVVLSSSICPKYELSKISLLFSYCGEIEIISEVKNSIWRHDLKIFTVAKNTLKIRQLKRSYDKFNKIDLELCICI